MKKIKGDLVKKALRNEFDVIIHGCNCQCTMGAGIAKTIKTEFPQAYQADLKTKKGDRSKLGSISSADVDVNGRKLIVVNAYTQFDWRGAGVKADYEAIRSAFKNIKEKFSGLRLAYPAIGAGLAGGDWKIISQIIEVELAGEDHTFVEFEKEKIITGNKVHKACFG
jgi:O-acetyl-ADP-ribose deacetylase (regulator of RNase III)